MKQSIYRFNHLGFTIIELMVTMAIFVIVMMLAIPSFNGYLNEKRLDSAAEQIASDIRHAQQMAQAEESYLYKIKFYPNYQYYQLMLNTKVLRKNYLPDQVKIVEGYFNNNYSEKHTLRFDAKGIPYPIGGHLILTAGNKTKYVIVASITGRVRVSDKLE